jgi:hypothetical protein
VVTTFELTGLILLSKGCIGDLYHSIKSDVDITLNARDRDWLTAESEILAIYHEPWTSLPTQGGREALLLNKRPVSLHSK